jgi:NAD(P)-dependent dehydrogenase (short-subunit alcohol dehydrogenase family)
MSRVWFVTGSSRGLGRAFVEVALEAGDRVAATARNPERIQDLVDTYGDARETSQRYPPPVISPQATVRYFERHHHRAREDQSAYPPVFVSHLLPRRARAHTAPNQPR